jgi:hypothetical protein
MRLATRRETPRGSGSPQPSPPTADRPTAGAADQQASDLVSDLYQAHALSRVRMAKLLLRDQPSAEDVVQDAFLRLYRALPGLRDRDHVLPYLRAAVINRSRSVLRSRQRARLRPVQHEPPASSAESAAMAGEDRRAVLAAAAAVVALAVGLSLATPLFGGRVSPPATGSVPLPTLGTQASRGVPASAPAPGVPRFYVTVYNAPAGPVNYIVVRDSRTGQVTARMNPPARSFFAGIAATAGDRTFVTAIQPSSGCASRLYLFRLTDQGRLGPLVPLHITVPGTYSQVGDLAITPDGRTIGYSTYLCNGEGEVGVIHLATRQIRVWSDTGFSTPMDLSLSADGRVLAYTMFPVGTRTRGGARILPTSAPAGSLARHSRVVSPTATWSALSADGATLYDCWVSPNDNQPAPRIGTLTYGALSLADGAQHVIHSWPGMPGPQCHASLDPAGNYLLVQFPVPGPTTSGGWVLPDTLDLRTGRLAGTHPPAFYGLLDIAW